MIECSIRFGAPKTGLTPRLALLYKLLYREASVPTGRPKVALILTDGKTGTIGMAGPSLVIPFV